MSYQVKSTPFIKRMLSVSKKNGQLQKLKEEYDRIKDFNEKAIEMKMRQVRLKRLFKEIEDINEDNFKRRRLTTKHRPNVKGPIDQRLENLLRAKEMGQNFSRRNGMGEAASDMGPIVGPTVSSRLYMLSKRQQQERERLKEERKRTRINMRIYYGNQISSWNMQKMLMGKLRTEVSEGMKQTVNQKAAKKNGLLNYRKDSQPTSDTSLDGTEKLKQRLTYGNTISDFNMKVMPKRRRNQNYSNDCRMHFNPDTDVTSALSDTYALREEQHEYQSCVDVQDYLVLENGVLQPLYTCDPKSFEKSRRAQKHWYKLAKLLRYRFETQISERALQTLERCEEDLEYQLRSISNDTNLLQTDFQTQSCEQLELLQNENSEEFSKNEILVRTECLRSATPPYQPPNAVGSLPPASPLPFMVQQRLSLKPTLIGQATFLSKEEEVTNLIKNYEPYSMEVVKKEIMELGVQKLREVFEHQNA